MKNARQSSRIEKSAGPELVEACKALKALPVSAAILDNSGRILAVNDTWREFARANGLCLPNEGIGADYLQYCADFSVQDRSESFPRGTARSFDTGLPVSFAQRKTMVFTHWGAALAG